MSTKKMTIIIDSAESHPWGFKGLKTKVDFDIRWRSLGRHPNSLGDYSVEGLIGRCHIERKSVADCQSTLLGFGDGHRERFESELANLSKVENAVVIVEGSMQDVCLNPPEFGKKTAENNAKILYQSIIAMQQDHKVGWMFFPSTAIHSSRHLAQHWAFNYLARAWDHEFGKKKNRRTT
ncbi:MAG: ERCC4 domain-containing protein [Rubripirellula sp.]